MEFQLEPGAGSSLFLVGCRVACSHLFIIMFVAKLLVPGTGKAISLGMKCLLFQVGKFRVPPCKLNFLPDLYKKSEHSVFPRPRLVRLCPHLGHSRSERHIQTQQVITKSGTKVAQSLVEVTDGRKNPVNTEKLITLGVMVSQFYSHQNPLSFKVTAM